MQNNLYPKSVSLLSSVLLVIFLVGCTPEPSYRELQATNDLQSTRYALRTLVAGGDPSKPSYGGKKYSVQMELRWSVNFGIRYTDDNSTVRTADWSPDGKLIAVTLREPDIIFILDANSGTILYKLTGHEDEILDVSWSKDGEILASVSTDKTLRFWRLEDDWADEIMAKFKDFPRKVAWSPTEDKLVVATEDRFVLFDNANDIKKTRSWDAHAAEITGINWSSDGSMIAASFYHPLKYGVKVWHVDTGWTISGIPIKSSRKVVFSNNDKFIYTSGGIYDLWTGCLLEGLHGNSGILFDWSPTQMLIAGLNWENKRIVIMAPGIEEEHDFIARISDEYGTWPPYYVLLWSPDGSQLLYSPSSRKIGLFDVSSDMPDKSNLLYENCSDEDQIASKVNSDQIQKVYEIQQSVYKGKLSSNKAEKELEAIESNIGKESLAWIISRVPMYDGENWQPFESYIDDFAQDSGVNPNSRLAKDPVSTGVDMFFGDYSPDEVFDWFGLNR